MKLKGNEKEELNDAIVALQALVDIPNLDRECIIYRMNLVKKFADKIIEKNTYFRLKDDEFNALMEIAGNTNQCWFGIKQVVHKDGGIEDYGWDLEEMKKVNIKQAVCDLNCSVFDDEYKDLSVKSRKAYKGLLKRLGIDPNFD